MSDSPERRENEQENAEEEQRDSLPQTEESPEDVLQAPIKRGRGRPKTSAKSKVKVPSSGRGRGRPKGSKKVASGSMLNAKEGMEIPEDHADNSMPSTSVVSRHDNTDGNVTSGRGRGRPKGSKNKVHVHLESAAERLQPEETEVMEDGETDDINNLHVHTSPVSSGRGRGRPKGSTKKQRYSSASNPDRTENQDGDEMDVEEEVTDGNYSPVQLTPKKRGRPKKTKKDGRGRPRKAAVEVVEKRSPGRPSSSPGSKCHPLLLILQRSISNQYATDGTERAKRPRKPYPERSVPAGKLRDTPRLSYKDESDSEIELDFGSKRRVKLEEAEADALLERKFRGSTEKKEAGSLRKKPRLSYKDESDSDIESGFESDTVPVPKSVTPPRRRDGRGRPRKVDQQKKRGRGRPRLHQKYTTAGYHQVYRQQRRGPGRPRLVQNYADEDEEDYEEHPGEQKRGRGRPKLQRSDDTDHQETVRHHKRGRGRPRSVPDYTVSDDEDHQDYQAKRKRGRPKKHEEDALTPKGPYVPTGLPRGRPPGGHSRRGCPPKGKHSKKSVYVPTGLPRGRPRKQEQQNQSEENDAILQSGIESEEGYDEQAGDQSDEERNSDRSETEVPEGETITDALEEVNETVS